MLEKRTFQEQTEDAMNQLPKYVQDKFLNQQKKDMEEKDELELLKREKLNKIKTQENDYETPEEY